MSKAKHKSKTKKSYVKNKKRKTIKKHHKMRKIRGGNVDDIHSADFNPNLAYDKKQIGGNNIGGNCYDPNFSIFNTRALQLFPYGAK